MSVNVLCKGNAVICSTMALSTIQIICIVIYNSFLEGGEVLRNKLERDFK